MNKLRWEPVSDAGEEIDEKLGDVLRARYGDIHGRIGEKGVMLDNDEVAYLEGLYDAGMAGAMELVLAIKTLGRIRIRGR